MLSDEQIWQLASQEGDTHDDSFIFNRDGRWSVLSFARAIESALSQSTEQGERDAARYRWLRDNFLGADFDYGGNDAEMRNGERVLLIRHAGTPVWGSLDLTVDAAMSPHGDGGRG